MLGYGAIAVRQRSFVGVWYRSYVYDRYNWDLGKNVRVPATALSYLPDDNVTGQVAGIKAPDGADYFASGKHVIGRDKKIKGYEVGSHYYPADALLGALEESGDAKRCGINGVGRIQYVSMPTE